MKEDVEEPVKKSGKVIASLILLLVFLIVTGVLLIKWYMENIRQQAVETDMTRVIISAGAILVLIILLTAVLINFMRSDKKHARKKTAKRTVAVRQNPASPKRCSTSANRRPVAKKK